MNRNARGTMVEADGERRGRRGIVEVAVLLLAASTAAAALTACGGGRRSGGTGRLDAEVPLLDADRPEASAADGGDGDAGLGEDGGDRDTGAEEGGTPPEACSTPGAVEVVGCGRCGTTERFCTAMRVWSYGDCVGEGECTPGTTERRPCGRCGTAEARCTTECVWTASEVCRGEGECTPGETMRTRAGCGPMQSRTLLCSAACTFETGPCEVDECAPGTMDTVPCGNCGTALRTCSADHRWVTGACTGEGECMPGTTSVVPCGRCGTQRTVCDTSCRYVPMGSCTGERSCSPGEVSSCTTSCGSRGTSTCSAACTPGACEPPAETCNGVDDDCDGMTDEDCAGCFGCAGATEVVADGGRYTVALAPSRTSGSCGGVGSEAYLALTLSATSDVFVTTHPTAGMDTVLYVRRCSCTGTEVACNDDADGRTSSVLQLTGLPAGIYTIVVDTKAAMSANVTVDVYVSRPGAAGDRCGRPRSLAAGSTRLTGDTCGFSNDLDTVTGAAGCAASGGGEGEDIVYYFYVPTARTLTFDGCSEDFTYDGTVYVRSVCNDASRGAEVVCDDDACAAGTGTCTSLGFGPRASATFAPGLYYLVVDGYRLTGGGMPTCAQCGPFDLRISGL